MAVYFLFSPEDPHLRVKIGFTKGSVANRIAMLQVGMPLRLVPIMVLEGNRRLEHRLHRHFHACRSHGEWFFPSPELKQFIFERCWPDMQRRAKEAMANETQCIELSRICDMPLEDVKCGLCEL